MVVKKKGVCLHHLLITIKKNKMKKTILTTLTALVLLTSCTKEEDLTPVCSDQYGDINVSYSFDNDCSPFAYGYDECSKAVTFSVYMVNQCNDVIYTHEFVKQYTDSEWFMLAMTISMNNVSQRQAMINSFATNYGFNHGEAYYIQDFNN